jgi:hypothetical protein
MTIRQHEQFPHGSIIQLESTDEEFYSFSLSTWINATIESQDKTSMAAISQLWDGESWESIVEKVRVEGSTWYVWWMDGVRTYMELDRDNPHFESSGATH